MLVSKTIILGLLFALISTVTGKILNKGKNLHDESGPWINATNGEPWPLPNRRKLRDLYYHLDSASFKFDIVENSCDILKDSIKRYKSILQKDFEVAKILLPSHIPYQQNIFSEEPLSSLKIYLKKPCEKYPSLSSNETYSLTVPDKKDNEAASLIADSIWGILRGLETFSQLVTFPDNKPGLIIRAQKIVDSPRLPHRGLLIDTSRHYLPVKDIKLILDAMSYNKLNVLHWHIVDDNSFPYESAVYPELSEKGAYHFSMIYTADDVTTIIEYARRRGIRVIPEFHTPGHTKSWGLSHPELLTPCYAKLDDSTVKRNGKFGPINPIKEEVYSFLKSLFTEVVERFPDKYIHLGGDKVPYDCWKSNPKIRSFMQKNNFSQYTNLEELHIKRVLEVVDELKVKPIVWQEVFDNRINVYKGTVIHVRTGAYQNKLAKVTSAGYQAILSACWRLDHARPGGDWLKFYHCDPLDFKTTSSDQLKLVLGGEACMWGEFVDRNNVHSRIWPRASAAAERLWSNKTQDDDTAAQRMEEHACRMNRRNIPAQPPNGSGFCVSQLKN